MPRVLCNPHYGNGVFAPFANGSLVIPHLQMEFCLIVIVIKFSLQMGNYQTPIYKWGKHPITVMGVAEDYGLFFCLTIGRSKIAPKILYGNTEDNLIGGGYNAHE